MLYMLAPTMYIVCVRDYLHHGFCISGQTSDEFRYLLQDFLIANWDIEIDLHAPLYIFTGCAVGEILSLAIFAANGKYLNKIKNIIEELDRDWII